MGVYPSPPGSYTKGGTLYILAIILNLGEMTLLICTKGGKGIEEKEGGERRVRKEG